MLKNLDIVEIMRHYPVVCFITCIVFIYVGIKLKVYGEESFLLMRILGAIAYVFFTYGGLIMAFIVSAFVFQKYFN